MKKIVSVLCLVGAVFAAQAEKEAASHLIQALKGQNDFYAEFTQTVVNGKGKQITTNQGEMALDMPNSFYWHSKSPETLILAQGSTVSLFDPELETLRLVSKSKAIESTPLALFLESKSKLTSHYDVKKTKACYALKPKKTNQTLAQIKLCFAAGQLSELATTDQQQITSRFVFANQRQLKQTDQKLFQFKAPKGTQVIDERLKK
jgi:outer membrane lipoprotein carrier protein